jgi:hypothetical protein
VGEALHQNFHADQDEEDRDRKDDGIYIHRVSRCSKLVENPRRATMQFDYLARRMLNCP